MAMLSILVVNLFFSNSISLGYTVLTNEVVGNSPSNLNSCTNAKECPVSDLCMLCKEGLGPSCEQPTCINGKCGLIKLCSQKISSTTITTPKSNQCKGTDASHCVVDDLCGVCTQGYSPECAEAVCINNQCEIIHPCSIYTSTESTRSKRSSSTTKECKNDDQCPHAEYCAVKCQNGSKSLCASAKCVHGECQTIPPCS